MNRQYIIDRMTLREKEIFKKYENTYPFPIRKFIEEIGIRIVEKNNQKFPMIHHENDGVNYITICKDKIPKECRSKEHTAFILALVLIYYFFNRDKKFHYHEIIPDNDYMDKKILAYELLMPKDILFKKLEQLGNAQKVAKYLGVPPVLIEIYMKVLTSNSGNSDVYH